MTGRQNDGKRGQHCLFERTLGQELSWFYRNQNYLFELNFNMFNIFQIFLTLKFGKRIKQVECRLKACCISTCNINVQQLAIYKNKCQMWAISAEQTTKKPQQGLNQQCLGNTGPMPMTIEPCVSFLNDEPFLLISFKLGVKHSKFIYKVNKVTLWFIHKLKFHHASLKSDPPPQICPCTLRTIFCTKYFRRI